MKHLSALFLLAGFLVASTVASQAADLELSETIQLPTSHSIGWVRTNTQPRNQRTWDWQLDDAQWQRAVQQKGEGKKELPTSLVGRARAGRLRPAKRPRDAPDIAAGARSLGEELGRGRRRLSDSPYRPVHQFH